MDGIYIYIHTYVYIYIYIHIYIYIYIYSLIADSSDKGSDRGLRLDNSRTKWTLAVSVRNIRRIRNVESSNVAVGGLCLFRVLSRSLSTENSVDIEPFTYCFVI